VWWEWLGIVYFFGSSVSVAEAQRPLSLRGNRVAFCSRRCISRGWRSKVTVAGSGSHLFVDVCAGRSRLAAHAALKPPLFHVVGGFAAPLAKSRFLTFVRMTNARGRAE